MVTALASRSRSALVLAVVGLVLISAWGLTGARDAPPNDGERVPTDAERLELAESFDRCVSDTGIHPLTYNPVKPDKVSAIAEATTKLGYSADDPALEADPRFGAVLTCFQTHELLFPEQFETAGN